MTSNHNFQDSSDIAALILAHIKDDQEAVKTVVGQIALGDNARAELMAALMRAIFLAGEAIKKDLLAGVERGDSELPSVNYLAAISQLANKHTDTAD